MSTLRLIQSTTLNGHRQLYMYEYILYTCRPLVDPYLESGTSASLRARSCRLPFTPPAIHDPGCLSAYSKDNIITLFNTNRVYSLIRIAMNAICIFINDIFICFGIPEAHFRRFRFAVFFYSTCLFGKKGSFVL